MEWYLIALLSAVFSAFAAILEKKILFKEKAIPMTFILGIFNLILCIPFFFFIDYSAVSVISVLVLLLKSILGAVAFIFVMQSIKHLQISKALPILALTPGIVAVFAFFILGEVLKPIEIGGVILLIIGTYILELKRKEHVLEPVEKALSRKGHYYAISALLIFTFTSILDKALLKNFKLPLNALFGFQHLFYALTFMVAMLIFSKKVNFRKVFKGSGRLIGVLALAMVVWEYSYLLAVGMAPVALVLSIKRIAVFFAVLMGGLYFKDKNLPRRVIATIMILAGAALIIMN